MRQPGEEDSPGCLYDRSTTCEGAPMAKAKPVPKVVRSADYEEAAMAFLRVMALEVDDALKEAKITDTRTRRKVVDNFCFGMGNFLDQYWFEAGDGKRYYPMVGFST